MTAPRLGIVVFARMSSQRLPGKVLMDFDGRPLLAHILARAAAVAQPVIVATSDLPEDAAVARLARACGATAYCGPLEDVLQRAVDCARHHRLDAFARLCGDRPYFPQATMRSALETMANALRSGERIDLLTNHLPDSPPPGLSTEVVRVDALECALGSAPSMHHREHLTAYLYDHADCFVIRSLPADFSATRPHRFAVDSADDLRGLARVAQQLGDLHATPEHAAALLDASASQAGR